MLKSIRYNECFFLIYSNNIMSDISLQRYKARRAFQSLKEDKHMDNSEYVKLRSVIQNVKETRKDVEDAVVDSVVADPQNFVYVFIVDDTFNESTSRATDTSYTHTGVRLITDVSVDSSYAYSIGTPTTMTSYAGSATTEDMIIKFNADITDDTNFYHYIKVHTDGIGLSGITTDTLATNIQAAILESINTAGSLTHDTIIKRVIVAHGTADIRTAYDAAYAGTAPTYDEYVTSVDGSVSDHISNVGDIIESINNNAASYMARYSSSNTIVLYPHNTFVSGNADTPAEYDYSGEASVFFRDRMTDKNSDYTLLYNEWSLVDDIEYAPSGSVYDGVNTLTPATHYRLGANLAALE